MKPRLISFALVALLTVGLGSSCGGKASSDSEVYPVLGVVVHAGAESDMRLAEKDCWVPAAAASPLFPGDSLQTGASSGLVVLLKDGVSLALGGETRADLKAGKGVTAVVNLDRGSAVVRLPSGASPVSIVTPATTVDCSSGIKAEAVSAVEVAPGGGTLLRVSSGQSTLSGGTSEVRVSEGQQSSVEPGQAPGRPQKVEGGVGAPPYDVSFLVGLLTDPYFRTRASRDQTADDARSKITIDPTDPWPHLNLARALLDLGSVADARAQFNVALELKPQFQQALAGLGRADLVEARWAEATDLYERSRRMDRESLESVLGIGQAALGAGDLAEAKKWFKELIELDPTSGTGYTGLGIVELLQGDGEGARTDLEKAATLEKGKAREPIGLGMLDALSGKMDLWKSGLVRAVDAEPGLEQARLSLACGMLRLGELDQAEAYYKSLTGTDDPGQMSAGYQGLGAVELSRGALEKALADFVKAQDLEVDRPPVLADLGQTHLLLEEGDAAAATFTRAVGVGPYDYYPHQWLARSYLDIEEYAGAEAESRSAIVLDPADWRSRLVLGLALQARGVSGEASVEFERGRSGSTGRVLTASDHVLLGRSYMVQGRSADALAEFRAARKMEPRNPAYRVLVGDALDQSGDAAGALAEYREALRIDSAFSAAGVKAASILSEQGERGEAIELLMDVVEKDPNDAAARGMLAQYLLDDDDVDGAVFQLEAAKALPGTSPEVLAGILITSGNALDRRQDFNGAVAEYTLALAGDPARGDAWYYMAGDLERLGRAADALTAYRQAVALCADNPEWKKFYEEASQRMR
ncbi:MAG: tetratricopeptide repeat protein [Actinomycetota bacterium]